MDSFKISEKVKILREVFNLTQSQLADILGMKQSQYSLVENGKQSLPLSKLDLLYEKLGVSPAWMIMTGDFPADKESITGLTGARIQTSGDSDAIEAIKLQAKVISEQQETIKAQQQTISFFTKKDGADNAQDANAG